MAESTPPEIPANFEAALDGLQQIVTDLEEGRLGLEDSLARFEQGIGLLKNCYRILEQAEQKIELLVRMEPDGQEVSAPFDAAATFESETPQKKPARRKAAKPAASASGETIPPATAESPAANPSNSEESGRPSLF